MVTIRATPSELLTDADARRGGVVATVRLGESTVVRRSHASNGPQVGGGRQVELRTAVEIEAIQAAAIVARAAVDAALRCAVIGATPASLASIASGIIAAERAESLVQNLVVDSRLSCHAGHAGHAGHAAFPASCCIAVNDRLIHAVPSDEPLCDGDVVTVDVAVRLGGWCADVADCVVVGRGTSKSHAMVSGCHEMLEVALATMAPGVRWSQVAKKMQDVAQARSLGLVTGYAGHGIGRALHEAPIAPCGLEAGFVERGDFTLLPDMVLSVEPTVVSRPDGIRSVDADGFAIGCRLVACSDGWTMRTESGAAGCSVERTVVITRSGCEILDEMFDGARSSINRSLKL
jgi:methionyl aminopeptidase